MELINENDEFKIYEDIENSKYKIVFNQPSVSLIESIYKCKLIPGVTIEDDYRTIHFKAFSVKSLSTRKKNMKTNTPSINDNDEILKICYYLSFQLKFLIVKHKKCFINYESDKIIVIDNNKYVFLSNSNLMSLESDENILICNSFKKTIFTSPELKAINVIPTSVNYRIVYYSLGLVLLYCLRQNINNTEITDENLLNLIEGTKLYRLIKGALETQIENRRLFYL